MDRFIWLCANPCITRRLAGRMHTPPNTSHDEPTQRLLFKGTVMTGIPTAINPILIGITMALILAGAAPISAKARNGPTAAEYGVVLNLSGKQRMLSQKMSKEIMLIALGVDIHKNVANLKNTSALFDKTLKGLRDGDPDLRLPPTVNKPILRRLRKIESLWFDFYVAVKFIQSSAKVSKKQVTEIASINLLLLKQMNDCVKMYEEDASTAGLKAAPGLAVTLNLSGKQRMLTQKMSKEFLLVALGHEVDNNRRNLLETTTLFERTLIGLLDGDRTLDLPGTQNPTIRAQLGVVQDLWKPFKPIVEGTVKSKTAKIAANQIASLASGNLPLLREMNKAVGMYEKEAGKQQAEGIGAENDMGSI